MAKSVPPIRSRQDQAEAAAPRASRPGSVTILVLGVLIITVINLIRLVLSIRYWQFLTSWPGIFPLYMALTGFIWTLAGSILLWGLWKAKIWAPRLMQAVALTYALYYWLDHIFLVDHPVNVTQGAIRALVPLNWQFAAGSTIVCLAYTAWTLGRHKVKAYFGLLSAETPQDKINGDDAAQG